MGPMAEENMSATPPNPQLHMAQKSIQSCNLI